MVVLASFFVATYAEEESRAWQELVLTEEWNAMRLQADGDVWHPPSAWRRQPQIKLTSALTKAPTTLEDVVKLVKRFTG